MSTQYLKSLIQTGEAITPLQLDAILKEFAKGLQATTTGAITEAAGMTLDYVGQVDNKAAGASKAAADLKNEVAALKEILPEQSFGRLSKAVDQFEDAQRQKVSISIKAIEKSIGQVLSGKPELILGTDDFENTLQTILRDQK